ncbi:MAG: DUF2752 domain-containing protein [Lachnospiraceae bacterium]|nr:DUF2752 domain-containing protein [Lachnospiraceae bacterium]
MDRTQRRAWLRHYWLLWLPPVLLVLAVLLYRPLLAVERFVADYILYCPFYELTGHWCPGCAGTRSLTALLHGQLLLAIHENPAVPVLAVTGTLLYVERVLALLGRPRRLVPRSMWSWGVLIACQLVWAVLRNFIPALAPIMPIN